MPGQLIIIRLFSTGENNLNFIHVEKIMTEYYTIVYQYLWWEKPKKNALLRCQELTVAKPSETTLHKKLNGDHIYLGSLWYKFLHRSIIFNTSFLKIPNCHNGINHWKPQADNNFHHKYRSDGVSRIRRKPDYMPITMCEDFSIAMIVLSQSTKPARSTDRKDNAVQ